MCVMGAVGGWGQRPLSRDNSAGAEVIIWVGIGREGGMEAYSLCEL